MGISWSSFGQAKTYASLYKFAYSVGNQKPDTAILYAQKAIHKAQNKTQKANAHHLLAFYAQKQGYYGLAVIHYKKALQFYNKPLRRNTLLNNMAACYKNAGNIQEAIKIGRKVSKHFAQQTDSVKFSYSINLLANCYRDLHAYHQSDSLFRLSLVLTKKFIPKNLSNVYHDYARLQEKLNAHQTGIQLLRRSIALSDNAKPLSKKIRFIQLASLYLQAKKLDSAQHFIHKAQSIPETSQKTLIFLLATEGLLHFVNREEAKARKNYQICDSLLKKLRTHSSLLIQKKFARKTAYEVYQQAYELLNNLWFYSGNKAQFAEPKDWFKQRMEHEKELYESIKISVALKDSLVIARTTPKTQVVRRLNPWWWALMAAVLVAGGWLLYRRRERTLRAHTDFVQAIKASPIKGFDNPKPQEIAMLTEIESRIKRQLKLKEIKILLMIARQSSYNQIHLATGIAIGTIKSIVKRLKDLCGVENIRDLM